MADPRLGNKADEQAQFEQGVDFEGINRSNLGEGDVLRITLAESEGDVVLTPERAPTAIASRGIALATTQDHQLMSQLVEEPEQFSYHHPVVGQIVTSASRMARIQSRNKNREELVWYGIRAKLQFAALDLPLNSNARILVRRDSLEGEYSCRNCEGRGYFEQLDCTACKGKAQNEDGIPCPLCIVLGYGRDGKWSSGKHKCELCHGVGWRAGVVIPEVAQNLPCTGIVSSLGPNTMVCKLGDRVLYSRYAGHNLDTPEKEQFTVMRESEILGLLRDVV